MAACGSANKTSRAPVGRRRLHTGALACGAPHSAARKRRALKRIWQTRKNGCRRCASLRTTGDRELHQQRGTYRELTSAPLTSAFCASFSIADVDFQPTSSCRSTNRENSSPCADLCSPCVGYEPVHNGYVRTAVERVTRARTVALRCEKTKEFSSNVIHINVIHEAHQRLSQKCLKSHYCKLQVSVRKYFIS